MFTLLLSITATSGILDRPPFGQRGKRSRVMERYCLDVCPENSGPHLKECLVVIGSPGYVILHVQVRVYCTPAAIISEDSIG